MTPVAGGAYTAALTVRRRPLAARLGLGFVRHGLGTGTPGEPAEVGRLSC
jgi:hypothetical protein